ncbi:MAG: peptidoglycan editing factor PgeF [Chloroflexi bacterium]|nr:peptidoglycan editing factor PgeF [Chloroflexota bacterium]
MHSGSAMKVHLSGGIALYSFNHLEPWPELTQGALARGGGVSDPPYDSLNTSFAVQDDPERVRTNRRLMAGAVGWDLSRVVSAGQVHGRQAVAVGRGNLGGPDLPGTDALVTNEPGVLLLLKFADCVPIILWDPVRRVVGLAHAGWRGTVLGTPAAALELMSREYGSCPSDVLAGIGPSIGPCCYEVGPEVATAAEREFVGANVLRRDACGRVRFDLWGANAETLTRAGVRAENVATAGICTRCHHDLFFSHRAAGGLTGRFGVVAGIRDE